MFKLTILKKVFEISFIKTIWINAKYFGGGVIHPCLIVSKNVDLKNLSGKVVVEDKTVEKIWLGFGNIGFINVKYDRMIWDVAGEIKFKDTASFSPGCKIVCMKKGKIYFGSNFSCNANSRIISNEKIIFGDHCMISWDCTFMDTDFHKIFNNLNTQMNTDQQIKIGNYVWICCDCVVLKGSVIPDNVVVSARSTLHGILKESNCIYKDHKKIKSEVRWEN